jgi:phosphoglycerate dehydrogenase-like enzyme
VLGLGRVGREVVRRLTPFDCDLVAVKRTPDGYLRELLGLMELAEAERLDVALDAADVLVVTCPLTSRTRGLLGRRELRRLRRTAYLVNVSRAEVVDEAALADALREEWIAGCALDVAYPPGGPLVGAPRLLRTPHLGPHSGAAVRRRAESVMDHLRALASGEPPPGARPRHPDAAGSEEEAT